MVKRNEYDSSWDEGNEEFWEEKYQEWEERDWLTWLEANLSFPFEVERKDDQDDAYSSKGVCTEPFRLGHRMKVVGLEEYEDDLYGVIVKVREGKSTGYVPLADLEVTSRKDDNFWPVREYCVWIANR